MLTEYTLEGTKIQSLQDFYDEVERVLIPGAEWGRNLDALNDILYGGFGTPEGDFKLVWKNSSFSKDKLGYSETANWIRDKMDKIHPSNITDFQERLDQMNKGEGKTLFDEILEIIKSHPNIELVLE